MKRIYNLLYEIVMRIMKISIMVAAQFSSKINHRWKHTRRPLSPIPQSFPDHRYWIHCASLGEFEQARPLIDALLEKEYGIILSFFSPSGYNYAKITHKNLIIEYLRIDTKIAARRWYNYYNPIALILVKYEIWYNHIRKMYQNNKPIYLISAHFHQTPWYLSTWAQPFGIARMMTHIFVQNEQSQNLLYHHGYQKVTITGDTRMDRVMNVGKSKFSHNKIEQFVGNSDKVYVWGSTWTEDERIAIEFMKKSPNEYKHIIAPHDINPERIKQLTTSLSEEEITFAYITDIKITSHARVLIVNEIGILKYIYRYATIAHIGGGWNKGVHNVLEAIVYLIPATVGPRNRRFLEIQELKSLGIVKEIADFNDIEDFLAYNLQHKKEMKNRITRYLTQNTGATDRILQQIKA